jgi:hypothetical protein
MTGISSQLVNGFPDGIAKTGADGVSVGGMGVLVGFGVGVAVGSGVLVKVGKLVLVGMGVSVGFGDKALQDANVKHRTKNVIALLMIFMLSLTFILVFLSKHSPSCYTSTTSLLIKQSPPGILFGILGGEGLALSYK